MFPTAPAWAITFGLLCSVGACAPAGPIDAPDPTRLSEAETMVRNGEMAPDASLYGFALNQPLALPTCENAFSGDVSETCFSYDQIRLAKEERPAELKFGTLGVTVDSSRGLQDIEATIEPKHVERVLNLLRAKYGPPDYVAPTLRRVPMWSWTFADLQVDLLGYSDLAGVSITTTTQRRIDDIEAEKRREAEEAAEAKIRGL